MKRLFSSLVLVVLLMSGTGSAGPLIVGNGSGLSEFNILFWQRQLGYFLSQCEELETCRKSVSTTDWGAIVTASSWFRSAEIRFEDERTMGQVVATFDRTARVLRLNKEALWLKTPTGELKGMNLEDTSDFLWKILEPQFLSGLHGLDQFRTEFKKVMSSKASEYTLTLADGRRLAAVNSGNSVAAFAILNDEEKAESLLFSSLGDFAECQSQNGAISPGLGMTLETLDFAYFVGRLGTEQDSDEVSFVDVVFHGPVVYDCKEKGETWREKANVRLSIRLSQQKKSYRIEPAGTRIRFNAIERL